MAPPGLCRVGQGCAQEGSAGAVSPGALSAPTLVLGCSDLVEVQGAGGQGCALEWPWQ